MGIFALLCAAMLLAFNVYSVDAITRLRTDIQIVRKSVAELLARTEEKKVGRDRVGGAAAEGSSSSSAAREDARAAKE
jgi:predicted aspartyl protease